MLAFAAHACLLAVRRRNMETTRALWVYAFLRLSIGCAAVWLGLGGGAAAGWTLAILILVHFGWRAWLQRQMANSES